MALIDVIFPKVCLGCRRRGKYMCDKCIRKVRFSKSICPICTRPSIDGFVHTSCSSPHMLDGFISVWRYEGIIKLSITKLKFSFSYDITNEITTNYIVQIKKLGIYIPTDAVFTPIPLHILRQRWRGFNQSHEIGKLVAKRLECRYAPDVLIRTKKRAPQTVVSDKDHRLKNIRGVFELNPKYKSIISKRTIVVVDDVWTTGATLREAGKVLKRNGAKVVWGMTLAH